MCFVSYVPTRGGFVFSSNRDEAPQRNAHRIGSVEVHSKRIYFPVDILGGSWVFASDRGDIICLLNGAFVNHQRKSKYRMSRGLMLKEYFNYKDPIDFFATFDFSGMEPFTTVIVTTEYFFDFVWDGSTQYIRELDRTQSYNWSSSTLYTSNVQTERSNWFYEALRDADIINAEEVKRIHQIQKDGREHDSLIMNRDNKVKTISITQIIAENGTSVLSHLDLVNNQLYKKVLTSHM